MNREKFINDLLEATHISQSSLSERLDFHKANYLLEGEETPLCLVICWLKQIFINVSLEKLFRAAASYHATEKLKKANQFDELLRQVLSGEIGKKEKYNKLLSINFAETVAASEFIHGK